MKLEFELIKYTRPVLLTYVIVHNVKDVGVKTLIDTGAEKALWYGSESVLKTYGAEKVSDNGVFRSASNDIVFGLPVYKISLNIRDNGNKIGINIRDLQVIVNPVKGKFYNLLLPYRLFRSMVFGFDDVHKKMFIESYKYKINYKVIYTGSSLDHLEEIEELEDMYEIDPMKNLLDSLRNR